MNGSIDSRVRPLVEARPYVVGITIYLGTILSSLSVMAACYRLAFFSKSSLTTEYVTPDLLPIGFLWGLIAGALCLTISHYLTNIDSAALALEYVESRFATVRYPQEANQ